MANRMKKGEREGGGRKRKGRRGTRGREGKGESVKLCDPKCRSNIIQHQHTINVVTIVHTIPLHCKDIGCVWEEEERGERRRPCNSNR